MTTITLHHLKHNACPVCKSAVKGGSKGPQHSNGEWFESVVFQCGSVINWSPNFRKEEIQAECPNNPEVQLLIAKREAAKQRLLLFIASLDTDDAFKNSLVYEVKSVRV